MNHIYVFIKRYVIFVNVYVDILGRKGSPWPPHLLFEYGGRETIYAVEITMFLCSGVLVV